MGFFEVVHTQRSIRRFKPDPVPDEAIWAMLDAAIRAPSGSNSQPWIWLVVRDDARRAIIAGAVRGYYDASDRWQQLQSNLDRSNDPSHRRTLRRVIDFVGNIAAAPVLIVPCLVGIASPDTDPRSLLSGSSIYGAVQNMMLAARAQGLGTVLTTFHKFIEDKLRAEFHLPENAVPVCVVPVGYPEGQRFGPTTRKPVETVTYWDDWGATAPRTV